MDDQSPLAMQFKEFDTDGDGKLNPDEVYELLKLLGKNIYKGSVTSVNNLAIIGSLFDQLSRR
jgi:Ca2+-binding EF-hand superfamily protein